MFPNITSRLLVDYNFVKYFSKSRCNFYFKNKTSPLLIVDLETDKMVGFIMPINYDDSKLVHMKPLKSVKF